MPISACNNDRPRCSLICVGSELLRGKVNTHASTLARRLASIGHDLTEEQTVGDDQPAMVRLIRRAMEECRIVIVTGGLGPTFDDLTREAAAEACGKRLVLSPGLLKEIRAKFRRARYHNMPPANQRQAYLLEGAIPIPNRVGTAPGQWIPLARRGGVPPPPAIGIPIRPIESKFGQSPYMATAPTGVLILLPGPPSELIPMLDDFVLPRLHRAYPAPPTVEAHLHFVGVPESVVDHKIRPIIAREKDVQFTILAHLGLVDFDIFVSDSSLPKARRRRTRIARKIQAVMGRAFYGMDRDYPLEKVVADAFTRRRATLAVAESCTGGMLAERLTDIPGSSAYFHGGVVSYSNGVKHAVLSVSEATLRKRGAVSKEAALEMASGVRTAMGSTWGLGITGIAGPSGGTSEKPVGLVFISLVGVRTHQALELHFHGSRDSIRQRAVIAALDLLRQI